MWLCCNELCWKSTNIPCLDVVLLHCVECGQCISSFSVVSPYCTAQGMQRSFFSSRLPEPSNKLCHEGKPYAHTVPHWIRAAHRLPCHMVAPLQMVPANNLFSLQRVPSFAGSGCALMQHHKGWAPPCRILEAQTEGRGVR